MDKLTLSSPPKGRGLVIKLSVDADYGGFYCSYSKVRFELCMGFIALRLFFMSEARLSYLESIVTIQDICKSHDISVNMCKSKD